jgi:hypothetical protein
MNRRLALVIGLPIWCMAITSHAQMAPTWGPNGGAIQPNKTPGGVKPFVMQDNARLKLPPRLPVDPSQTVNNQFQFKPVNPGQNLNREVDDVDPVDPNGAKMYTPGKIRMYGSDGYGLSWYNAPPQDPRPEDHLLPNIK